jgi:hypothetical protein
MGCTKKGGGTTLDANLTSITVSPNYVSPAWDELEQQFLLYHSITDKRG